MFFFKNLVVFLLGLGCQTIAAIFPAFSAFGPIGGLLLSAANMAGALDGSFAKHISVFLLGMACNVVSIALKSPAASAALIPAGALLMQMSSLAKILSGVGLTQAGAVVAGKPPLKAGRDGPAPLLDTSALTKAPSPTSEEITADDRPSGKLPR